MMETCSPARWSFTAIRPPIAPAPTTQIFIFPPNFTSPRVPEYERLIFSHDQWQFTSAECHKREVSSQNLKIRTESVGMDCERGNARWEEKSFSFTKARPV